MKKIASTIIIVCSLLVAKGEYMDYLFQLEITSQSGESFKAFTLASTDYFNTDSLEDLSYLKSSLDMNYQHIDKSDTLVYFEDLITYNYIYPGDETKYEHRIHDLQNIAYIAEDDIKAIRIVKMQEEPMFIAIATPLELEDTAWTQQKPLSSYNFSAYLCSFMLFVHSSSSRIVEYVAELQLLQEKIDRMEIDYRNGDEMDEALWELVEKLFEEKVVVIAECTC